MVWIVSSIGAWLTACVFVGALLHAAARADRRSADLAAHVARAHLHAWTAGGRSRTWLAPVPPPAPGAPPRRR
ncbi:hypothetical protein FSW04_15635 [Baekduia soli]|uniref:Uncharacterized protein n=1 Tax=Baekduia soli TaxID=496014 RepID=A0A5B8U704_9ACTN|nr:hypothetical protein [Baekduia soli]QEC48863.1 hypothetical protein FSW04_15635 [Baekduia soli]